MSNTYKLAGWFYEGNHENGKDTINHSDMEQLARDLGITMEGLFYDVRGVLSRQGESTVIKGKTVTLKTLRLGKKDGFGRSRTEVYEVRLKRQIEWKAQNPDGLSRMGVAVRVPYPGC